MAVLPKSVEKVIEAFERLPGIGPKSAARMAYHFLRAPKSRSVELANALVDMKDQIVTCSSCFNVADSDPCTICADIGRDSYKICVVEAPLDVVAIEKAQIYSGFYHVLGGVISPADGIAPENLRMAELKKRILSKVQSIGTESTNGTDGGESIDDGSDDINLDHNKSGEKRLEVIIATNPSLEGEATAAYIYSMIKELSVNEGRKVVVTRIAMGLPTGADLEYADRLTLKRALENRTNL